MFGCCLMSAGQITVLYSHWSNVVMLPLTRVPNREHSLLLWNIVVDHQLAVFTISYFILQPASSSVFGHLSPCSSCLLFSADGREPEPAVRKKGCKTEQLCYLKKIQQDEVMDRVFISTSQVLQLTFSSALLSYEPCLYEQQLEKVVVPSTFNSGVSLPPF